MTISVNPLFEKGKTYSLSVLFVNKAGRYVNAVDKSGAAFKIEVPVAPEKGIASLKDKSVDFVCTEVTDRGPEFALASKYFAAAPKVIRGANIGLGEGLKVEFKKSLIYSSTSHQPDSDQPFEIAKEIAAFMNTEGGDLYMGVDDNGYVTGIEGDYSVLGNAPLMMGEKTDATWSYPAKLDGYKRKLTNAVLFYLGTAAAGLLDDFEEIVEEDSGLTYLKIHVNASADVIYLGRSQSVVYRAGSSVAFLSGRQREQYVKQRFFLRGEKSASEALAEFKKNYEALEKQVAQKEKELSEAIVKGSEKALEKVVSITGTKYQVEKDTCLPLDEKFLVAMEKPFGLVYKAGVGGSQRFMPCGAKKTWQALYEQLLNLCAEIDPVKFAALPDNPDFEPRRHSAKTKPNFVRRKDRVRLSAGSGYLGKEGDIRANLQCASKSAFLNETSLPRRLMTHFGIQVKDIRIWNGK